MTVYLPPGRRTYRYDFRFRNQRYAGCTGEATEQAARHVEDALRRELRLEAGGLAPVRFLKGPPSVSRDAADANARSAVAVAALLAQRQASGLRLYFIATPAHGPIKIGVSVRPTSRLRQLQTSNAVPLTMLLAMPGTKAVERYVHERFAETHMTGEWFQRTDELLALIAELRARKETEATEIASGAPAGGDDRRPSTIPVSD
jgi:hypothetical protein